MNRQDPTISLIPMTRDMYHAFFREYQNPRELYLDPRDYTGFIYDPQWVDAYIQRRIDRKRIPLAIPYGDEIIGEVKLYDIVDGVCATLGIALKNTQWTDRGFGTVAKEMVPVSDHRPETAEMKQDLQRRVRHPHQEAETAPRIRSFRPSRRWTGCRCGVFPSLWRIDIKKVTKRGSFRDLFSAFFAKPIAIIGEMVYNIIDYAIP